MESDEAGDLMPSSDTYIYRQHIHRQKEKEGGREAGREEKERWEKTGNWQVRQLQATVSSLPEGGMVQCPPPHLLDFTGIVQLHFGYHTTRVQCCSRSLDIMDAARFYSC